VRHMVRHFGRNMGLLMARRSPGIPRKREPSIALAKARVTSARRGRRNPNSRGMIDFFAVLSVIAPML
jgi:hypothetical protein